jgi:DNA-binding NarL/FixJ family response regulator
MKKRRLKVLLTIIEFFLSLNQVYSTLTCKRATIAKLAYNQNTRDLLFDIKLPDIPGDEITEIICTTYPMVKVIAFTDVVSLYDTKLMMKK